METFKTAVNALPKGWNAGKSENVERSQNGEVRAICPSFLDGKNPFIEQMMEYL